MVEADEETDEYKLCVVRGNTQFDGIKYFLGGVGYGTLISIFMKPPRFSKVQRLIPVFAMGVIGIFADDHHIKTECRV